MKARLGFVVAVATCVLVGILVGIMVKYITFDRGCGGRLARASNANTVEMARTELQAAITYCKDNGLTAGYTSVVYTTPDEDIGFWYNNLCASEAELASLPASAAPLEKSNMLMKLRETLTDSGERGARLVCPSGISRYPGNGAWAFGLIASLIVACIGWLLFAALD